VEEIVEPALEVRHNPGAEPDEPLSDDARLDLLSGPGEKRGGVPAAEVMGVNNATMAACCDSRQMPRRVRQPPPESGG